MFLSVSFYLKLPQLKILLSIHCRDDFFVFLRPTINCYIYDIQYVVFDINELIHKLQRFAAAPSIWSCATLQTSLILGIFLGTVKPQKSFWCPTMPQQYHTFLQYHSYFRAPKSKRLREELGKTIHASVSVMSCWLQGLSLDYHLGKADNCVSHGLQLSDSTISQYIIVISRWQGCNIDMIKTWRWVLLYYWYWGLGVPCIKI